jgi:hypothetical protein
MRYPTTVTGVKQQPNRREAKTQHVGFYLHTPRFFSLFSRWRPRRAPGDCADCIPEKNHDESRSRSGCRRRRAWARHEWISEIGGCSDQRASHLVSSRLVPECPTARKHSNPLSRSHALPKSPSARPRPHPLRAVLRLHSPRRGRAHKPPRASPTRRRIAQHAGDRGGVAGTTSPSPPCLTKPSILTILTLS